jgi:hypothetical protein
VPNKFSADQKKYATDAVERRVAKVPGPKPASRATSRIAGTYRIKGGKSPSATPTAYRSRVAAATATSANPYRRGQVCNQYWNAPMVSLRSAELIANLSLHGIPWV